MDGRKIDHLFGREILDSRGHPTVEVELVLSSGQSVMGAVASGASTGSKEALEKRDGDKSRYGGYGVLSAIANVNEKIAPSLKGLAVTDTQLIDQRLLALDGSDDKSNLGANAILAVSLAVQKAAAKVCNRPLYDLLGEGVAYTLPVPMMNVINGGVHASNNLDIQEFMIVPHGFDCFSNALRAGVEIFHQLRQALIARGWSTAVGDEGGVAPDIKNVDTVLSILVESIVKAGYKPASEVSLALDCAASEFYRQGRYCLPSEDFEGDSLALVDLLSAWANRYPIVSIEDACDENDGVGWRYLTEKLGGRLQLVGDDLFVTNPKILAYGISQQWANALLVKPNQIGTISQTKEAIMMAKQANYQTILSHRSGETEYSDIADLAVGFGCHQIKTGAPCRGERTAKYNRLLRIEHALGDKALYSNTLFGQEVK